VPARAGSSGSANGNRCLQVEPGSWAQRQWAVAIGRAARGRCRGLLTLWFAGATVLSLVLRGGAEEARRVVAWDEGEVKSPVTRRVRRLRLYALIGLGTAAAGGSASMLLSDALRRVGAFVSPQCELEVAWPVDLPLGWGWSRRSALSTRLSGASGPRRRSLTWRSTALRA
jgi:hypothetical protein